MEKDRGTKIAIVIVTIIAVVAVGVAFASYSTALNISGQATVKAPYWEVKFGNLSSAVLTGFAKEVTPPTIKNEDTAISKYDVKLAASGDSASYTFDVINNGTIDAKISSINVATPVCTGTGENAANDAKNVCDVLSYVLTYEDGSAVNIGDQLASGDSKKMKVKLTYGAIAGENLPLSDVSVSELNVSIIYSQK